MLTYHYVLLSRISELPEADWGKLQQKQPVPTGKQGLDPRDINHIPQPQYGQFEPLSRTQEIPRGKIDLVRASVESLPNFSTQGQGHSRDLSGKRVRQLDSDFHGNSEETPARTADFHGKAYPLSHNHEQGHGQDQTAVIDRDNILRQSIEDFSKYKEAYEAQQAYEGHQGHYYGNADYPCSMEVHPHYHAAEHPYDQAHYYHSHDQVHPGHHQGYEGHYHDNLQPEAHHHFRNIYTDRPYHTIGERGETEGGNVEDMHFYHHGYQHMPYGYHDNSHPVQGNQRAENLNKEQNQYAKTIEKDSKERNGSSERSTNVNSNTSMVSTGSGRKLPQVTYRFQNISSDSQKESQRTPSKPKNKKGTENSDKAEKEKSNDVGYKVKYERDGGGKQFASSKTDAEKLDENDIERDFMDQGKS